MRETSSPRGKEHKFHVEGTKDGSGTAKSGSFKALLGGEGTGACGAEDNIEMDHKADADEGLRGRTGWRSCTLCSFCCVDDLFLFLLASTSLFVLFLSYSPFILVLSTK